MTKIFKLLREKLPIQYENMVRHYRHKGVQYAGRDYVDALHLHGFQISMARRGNPYGNAVAESFLKTLKTEEGYFWEYETLAEAEKRVPYFIQEVYYLKWLYPSLSNRHPEEFERMNTHTPDCPPQN